MGISCLGAFMQPQKRSEFCLAHCEFLVLFQFSESRLNHELLWLLITPIPHWIREGHLSNYFLLLNLMQLPIHLLVVPAISSESSMGSAKISCHWHQNIMGIHLEIVSHIGEVRCLHRALKTLKDNTRPQPQSVHPATLWQKMQKYPLLYHQNTQEPLS